MEEKVKFFDSDWIDYVIVTGAITLFYVIFFAVIGGFAATANASTDYANQYETLQQTIIDEYNYRLTVAQNNGKPVDVQEFENSNSKANFGKYVTGNGRQLNNKLVDQFNKLLTKTNNKLAQRLKTVNNFIAHKVKIDYPSLMANQTIYEKELNSIIKHYLS